MQGTHGFQRIEPRSFRHRYPPSGPPNRHQIRPSDGQSGGVNIGEHDLDVGGLSDYRQTDGARAGAQVCDAFTARIRVNAGFSAHRPQLSKHHVDEHLRLGPRDQHPLVDHQVQLSKGPMTQHVLDGLSSDQPPGHRFDATDPSHCRRIRTTDEPVGTF